MFINNFFKILTEEPSIIYNVDDIARYIINYCNENNYDFSNLKLQKILYFIQASYLSSEIGIPCFKEDFIAWGFGPIIEKVYRTYSMYGSGTIPYISNYNICDFQNFIFEKKQFDKGNFLIKDKKIIDNLLDELCQYSSTTLTSVTLNQEPWKNAYIKGKSEIISKESIRDYFIK